MGRNGNIEYLTMCFLTLYISVRRPWWPICIKNTTNTMIDALQAHKTPHAHKSMIFEETQAVH